MRQGRHGSRLVVEIVTEAQRKVFSFVAQFLTDHGWPPTTRQIADELGSSPSTVHVHLQRLRDAGYLAGKGRELRLGWLATQGQDAAR